MTITRDSATVIDPSVPGGDTVKQAVLKNSDAIDDTISQANTDIADAVSDASDAQDTADAAVLAAGIATSDYSGDIAAAITAIGSTETTLTVNTACTLAANLTIPSNVNLVFRGNGYIGGAYTLTLDYCNLDASAHHIFRTGLTVAGYPRTAFIYAEWFGADSDVDVVQDDTTAIQTAMNLISHDDGSGINSRRHTVQLLDGTYYVKDLQVPGKCILQGVGDGTRLAAFSLPTNSVVRMFVGATAIRDFIIDNRVDTLGGTADALWVVQTSGGVIDNMEVTRIRNVNTAGFGLVTYNIDKVILRSCRFSSIGSTGLVWLHQNDSVLFDACEFQPENDIAVPVTMDYLVKVSGTSTSATTTTVNFRGCWWEFNSGSTVTYPLDVSCSGVDVQNGHFNAAGTVTSNIKVRIDTAQTDPLGTTYTSNGERFSLRNTNFQNIDGSEKSVTFDSDVLECYIAPDNRGVTLANISDSGIRNHTEDVLRPDNMRFRLQIQNNAGTVQHRINNIGDTSVAANATFISAINGASSSFTNTPTGPDASTAFAAGGKIASAATNTFIFDMAYNLVDVDSAPISIIGRTTAGVLNARTSVYSTDVNGVSAYRVHLEFYDAATGNAFPLTGLGVGEYIQIQIYS